MSELHWETIYEHEDADNDVLITVRINHQRLNRWAWVAFSLDYDIEIEESPTTFTTADEAIASATEWYRGYREVRDTKDRP